MNIIQSVKRRVSRDRMSSSSPFKSKPTASMSSSSDDSPTIEGKSSLINGALTARERMLNRLAEDLPEGPIIYTTDMGNPFAELPLLQETPFADQQLVLRLKLRTCRIVFDFTNEMPYIREREAKRQALLDILEYVNQARSCYDDSVAAEVVAMTTANMFRSLPPPRSQNPMAVFDLEEDEPVPERSWPHLQIVYEIFFRFIVSNEVDVRSLRKYLDQAFIVKFLSTFESDDSRERDYLKTILHRIYGKMMAMRAFIRRSLQHFLLRIISESASHNGVAEMLEILGSIINGFALPLKEEHKLFLEKCLIPLHTARSLNAFYQPLSYCVAQYVEKDSRLAGTVIKGLLRFWPVVSPSKEVQFLTEIEELLELTQPPEFDEIKVGLFQRVAKSITSPHFQVAERALFYWNNDSVVRLINDNRKMIFPIIVGPLYHNSNNHWNSTVHGLTCNVLKLLMEADPPLFDSCSAAYQMESSRLHDGELLRRSRWNLLEKAYEERDPKQLTNEVDQAMAG
ncbi:Serine/threonine-protein phosphatase 2A 56 kDa regulatory subunit delta isoform [Perkinsus chesapeaki]|uniref:Serine/threonine protein phosphatase 2A regulatory subunit n=1 Tax=Perkinsus chesapeaki TaxID=330153 RepID=A0A7J6LB56_PERCH|nr:Serine/threonine-protein phosphatase 2A 56 kDa regulatory subunit delta isoform [Perkinsus chesapeaki]